MEEIYNKIYDNVQDYDEMIDYKIELINSEFEKFPKETKIIDIGCGKGHYLKHLLSKGYNDILGVEFSKSCAEQHLKELPHVNADFIMYSQTIEDKKYDMCLCMDVLEHIPYDKIETMVESISRIGNNAVLGIANHSDIFMGEELHVIQENSDWWEALLLKYFSSVEKIYQRKSKFFVFRCVSK